MTATVARDARRAAADTAWIKMIIPDGSVAGAVARLVALWSHENAGTPISEIGWMVRPEFQGRGIVKTAVRILLEQHGTKVVPRRIKAVQLANSHAHRQGQMCEQARHSTRLFVE
jgi:RimJ/RimL family protein N-acetyltransferase